MNKRIPEEKIVIGLMMGTSMDGIDAAITKIIPVLDNENNLISVQTKMIESQLYLIPPLIKESLVNLVENKQCSLEVLCKLNFKIGHILANAVNDLVKKSGMKNSDIDFIGSHGQTVYHYPFNLEEEGILTKSTLQIGEPSIIAELTGIDTIADFRPRDIAAGGHGAPLVCFADYLMFYDTEKTRLIQNIGGISNVTVISPDKKMLAFDNGPGNALIDAAVNKLYGLDYDKDAQIALTGHVNQDWVNNIIADEPYFTLLPPKTTGKELFNSHYLNKILDKHPLEYDEDIIASLTALTAQVIANSYKDFILKDYKASELILGGGGTHNKLLVSMLFIYLGGGLKILTHEDYGISTNFKEALAFAILAYASYYGIPNNIPSCTGAKHPVVMGKFIPAQKSKFIIA